MTNMWSKPEKYAYPLVKKQRDETTHEVMEHLDANNCPEDRLTESKVTLLENLLSHSHQRKELWAQYHTLVFICRL